MVHVLTYYVGKGEDCVGGGRSVVLHCAGMYWGGTWGLWCAIWPPCSWLILCFFPISQRGMKAHQSQLTWFRILYMTLSRYVHVNTLNCVWQKDRTWSSSVSECHHLIVLSFTMMLWLFLLVWRCQPNLAWPFSRTDVTSRVSPRKRPRVGVGNTRLCFSIKSTGLCSNLHDNMFVSEHWGTPLWSNHPTFSLLWPSYEKQYPYSSVL